VELEGCVHKTWGLNNNVVFISVFVDLFFHPCMGGYPLVSSLEVSSYVGEVLGVFQG